MSIIPIISNNPEIYSNIDAEMLADIRAGRSYNDASQRERFSGADGDDESGELDTTDSTANDESGVPVEDLPRFRQLVKAKKTELKTQYGQGHCEVTESWGGKNVGDTVSWFQCKIYHPGKTKWVRGWRWQWKEFKESGGKAILKQQAKGTSSAPIPITEALDSTWVKIGKENDQITVPAGTIVRFGKGSNWIQKTASGTFPATRTYFGSDPAYGVKKEVYKKVVTSVTGTSSGTSTNTISGTGTNWEKIAIIGGIAVVVILGLYFGYKKFIK